MQRKKGIYCTYLAVDMVLVIVLALIIGLTATILRPSAELTTISLCTPGITSLCPFIIIIIITITITIIITIIIIPWEIQAAPASVPR